MMMLSLELKDGVVLTARHFDAEIYPFYKCILEKWPITNDYKVCITAAYEERKGFHGLFRAFDVRTHNIKSWGQDVEDRRHGLGELAVKCRIRLGRHWDVIPHLELAGTPQEHIHFEFDEKGNAT